MTATQVALSPKRADILTAVVVTSVVAISCLIAMCALVGGMRLLLMTIACGLAFLVYLRPQEAPGAGMLFLFSAGIILPYASRFDYLLESQEMFYWAVGLLLITVAAVAGIGVRSVFTVPASGKLFLAVALVAAGYGWIEGAAPSYVARQFYGILLLILYLGIALRVGSEELLVKRIRTFGVLCAVFFFVYYIAVFPKYGFHKEIGFNGTQASLLASILFVSGMEHRKRSWMAGGLVLLLVAVLVFMRKDVLGFLGAVTIAQTMNVKSRKMMFLGCGAFVLITMVALFVGTTQMVSDQIEGIPVVSEILPSGAQGADSLYDRTLQLVAALETVRAHPVLGAGLGSDIEWESPFLGFRRVAYVDNGWAYILQKMGFLGLGAFLWFLVTVFRSMTRQASTLSACLMSAVAITQFSQPLFVHFTTAPYLGTFAGLLLMTRTRRQPELSNN